MPSNALRPRRPTPSPHLRKADNTFTFNTFLTTFMPTVSAKLIDNAKRYRYVGNLPNSVYLCFDTAKAKLKELAKPTFLPDYDIISKHLANTDEALREPSTDAEPYTRSLYPIRRPHELKSNAILDIACSKHGTETHAYVQVHDAQQNLPVWTKLKHYLAMDKSHYSVLQQHSRHRQKHGDTNVHYPCFAQCAARPVDRMKYHPATIVSVDHDPDAKLRYQVYFDSMDKHSTAYCDTDAVVLDSTVKAMLVAARDSGDDPADFPDDVFMDEPDDVKATAALLGPNRHHWEAAKHKEMDGVTEEGRAVMVKSFPKDAKVLPTKLVCKKKRKPDGTLDKFKMRCTTRGDLDKSYYSDFDVFAPTANLHTFRLLMTLCILHGCMPYHYDVSQAFLQAPIPEDEQYYIKFPKQYTHPDGYIGAKMLYALYGHRTSGRLWSDTAHKFMSDNFPTLKRSTYDECLYIGTVDGKLLFVLIYVDDFVVGAQDEATRVNFHNRLMNTFTATYSGVINQFLQLKIDVTTKVNDNGDSVPVKIDISNERSIEHLAAKFQINAAKQQPRSLMLEGLNIKTA
ncbi:hypothetical protein CYMTET_9705 [Cymbomonas tetramitiformis]|uniref:Reverse transcriptase Ty1/copia-type domain-containing protein n=1 Tax=Cymbomonas tetramitiformis TaxID=36881 RepID=A0AAE0GQL3_9CHLO|nr:hypothetical protein CYMTET_9705 [Cymbomonas tetramitiformis]